MWFNDACDSKHGKTPTLFLRRRSNRHFNVLMAIDFKATSCTTSTILLSSLTTSRVQDGTGKWLSSCCPFSGHQLLALLYPPECLMNALCMQMT